MTDPDLPAEKAAREAFLELYRADLEAERIRSLADYQAQFPGHEDGIADEWRWLEPATMGVAETRPRVRIEEQIGPYRILEELGHGAQATVYLAEHETLRRQVALKVLRAPLTDGTSTFEQRFRREAEVTASIEHANICSVYEAGTSDGAAWIAMQYVPGSTLATHLMRSDGTDRESTVQLPADASSEAGSGSTSTGAARRSDLMRVVAFAEQAARALHVAHERGLVHRDIKPGNLMVTESGQPVILDFGLAHAGDRDGFEGLGLTRTNDVLGTPYYMAPEQLRAPTGGVDRRVDVYALGVTLFECLTRQRPFQAVSVEALYQQILTVEPAAPRSINPHIPRDLEVVLLTAIDKDRNRRYRTALDLAEDLRRVRQHEPIRARPISSLGRVVRLARRYPGVAASLSVAVVSLVVGLVTSLWLLAEKDAAARALEEEFTASYTEASQAATRADVWGVNSDREVQLRRRAARILETEAPAIAARVRGFEASLFPNGPRDESIQELGELLRATRDLGGIAREAVADLTQPLVRMMLANAQTRRAPAMEAQAVELAGLQVECLENLRATDERTIRARILWLDGLNQLRPRPRFAQAMKLAERWLRADPPGSAPDRLSRIALYESRLGASLFGLSQLNRANGELSQASAALTQASDYLERSVPIVEVAYPNSWYSVVAMANLLLLREHQASSAPAVAAVARYRRKMILSALGSMNYRRMFLGSGYILQAVWQQGRSRRAAMGWILKWSGRARRGRLNAAALAELENELVAVRRTLGIGDTEPENAIFAAAYTELAGSQSQQGFALPSIGRLTELAVQGYDRVGSICHCSLEAKARAYRGYHLSGSGDYAGALRLLREAVDLCRDEIWIRSEFEGALGWCRAQLGDYELAEAHLCHAIEIAGEWNVRSQVKHLHRLTGLYQMWGKLDQAVAVHERAIEVRAVLAADHALLGATYLQFGKLAEARAAIEKGLAVAAGAPLALRLSARVSLLEDEWDQAVATVADMSSAGNGPKQIILARRISARALLARGDVRDALEHFKAGADAPGCDGGGFWSDYGIALVRDGQADAGRKLLADLTDRRQGDPLAWYARAQFLASTKGLEDADRNKAVECAVEANRLCKGRRAFVLAMLAEAQFRAGDKASALQTAARVAKMMDGRDVQWLTMEKATTRFARYRV